MDVISEFEQEKEEKKAGSTMAQGIEHQLDKRYSYLAEKTSDPDGKAMFEWLAKEEQSHLDLLTTVYWNLNDRGVLSWPGL